MQDAPPSCPLLVGIDVGGTKTHLRALAGAETVADHVRASSDWRPHDTDSAARWLADLVEEAL
ncbi:ATPase, partial [Streptomyces sp. S6]